MPTSKIRIYPSSFGKTSYVDSEFYEQLLQIIGHGLIVSSFENFLEVKYQEFILNTLLSTKQRASECDK